MKAMLVVAVVAVTVSAEPLSHTNLLQFVAVDGSVQPVRSTNDWLHRRTAVVRAMQTVMGPLPGNEKRVALDVHVIEQVDCGDFVRQSITYAAEPGARVPAYLLVPKSVLGSRNPVAHGVVALHQTHPLGHKVVVGLANSSNDVYGVELAKRGYVCIAPPYPLLAEYRPDLRKLGYASGTMKAIWDNIRALDVLETLPYVHRGSFAAIGHSLGGHNSIYTAVFDDRIKVVVSSCGFDSYRDYKDGDITGWTSERYMPRLKEFAPDKYPFDFHEIIAALAPRAVFVSAPVGDTNFKWRSVDAVAKAAADVFRLYGVPQRLRVEHPQAGHVFSREMRQEAYRFIEAQLRAGERK